MYRLANTITDYYIRKKIIAEEKREIYFYGFKLIIADVINYVIIISLGIVFNRLIESIAFLITLCGLRQLYIRILEINAKIKIRKDNYYEKV